MLPYTYKTFFFSFHVKVNSGPSWEMAFGRTSALATVCHLSFHLVSLVQCLFHRSDMSRTHQMSLETSNGGVKQSEWDETIASLLKCLFSAYVLPRCLHSLINNDPRGKKKLNKIKKNCGLWHLWHTCLLIQGFMKLTTSGTLKTSSFDVDIARTRPSSTALTFIGVKHT